YHWDHVDVVLSGINLGSNLGNAIWHSGTLAGAKQAALLGLRGIALSTPASGEEADFDIMRPWVARVLAFLLPAAERPLDNVNFPDKVPRGVLQAAGHHVTYRSSKAKHWSDVLDAPADVIAVAGGDGTIGKVVERMRGRAIPIAILPIGTANNIA